MNIRVDFDTKTNTAKVVHENNGRKQKTVTSIRSFYESLSLSVNKDYKGFKPIFGLLSKKGIYSIVQTIQIGEFSNIYIVKVEKQRIPFSIYGNFYGLCEMPTMLFAIKAINNASIDLYTVCIKETEDVTEETKIYKYPFSNVSNYSGGSVCTGANKLNFKVNKIDDLIKAINYFYEMPNTGEDYHSEKNALGLEFRDFAKLLSKEDFKDSYLVENEKIKSYKDWINYITNKKG